MLHIDEPLDQFVVGIEVEVHVFLVRIQFGIFHFTEQVGRFIAIQERREVISRKLHKKETTANHAVVSFLCLLIA